MKEQSNSTEQQCNKQNVTNRFICTECGGDATIAMCGWQDNNGKEYYKKGERLCMRCHHKRTGMKFF